MTDPIIPEDPGADYYYRCIVQFDEAESNAQHKAWCGDMYDHLLALANGVDPIEELLVETIPGSDSMTVILFADDTSEAVRRGRLRDIANKHKGAQLYGPNPMPNPWSFKHRR